MFFFHLDLIQCTDYRKLSCEWQVFSFFKKCCQRILFVLHGKLFLLQPTLNSQYDWFYAESINIIYEYKKNIQLISLAFIEEDWKINAKFHQTDTIAPEFAVLSLKIISKWAMGVSPQKENIWYAPCRIRSRRLHALRLRIEWIE